MQTPNHSITIDQIVEKELTQWALQPSKQEIIKNVMLTYNHAKLIESILVEISIYINRIALTVQHIANIVERQAAKYR